MIKLGLFPLGIVMLPHASLPLHIFEERYKDLINDCENNHSFFGINLINTKNMNDIGCSARIEKILRRYDDGKIDVIVEGVQRYKLLNFSEGEKSYFIGEIEYYNDIDEEIDTELLTESIEMFNEIVSKITTVKIDKFDNKIFDFNQPSFLIAQKSGLSIKQRQNLLEIQSENVRLQTLIDHLRRLMPIVKETELLSQIVKNDGYFPPKNFKI